MQIQNRANIIVYHGIDADGWFSCTILKKYIKEILKQRVHRCVPMNYGASYEEKLHSVLRSCHDDFTIWMADFTCSDEFMNQYAEYIMHFDHHISKLEPRAEWRNRLKGDYSSVYDPRKTPNQKDPSTFISACELVWNTLFTTEMPKAVHLVGRRDVWDNTDEVENFSFGIKHRLNKAVLDRELPINALVESDFFKKYLEPDFSCNSTIKLGKTINEIETVANYEPSIRVPTAKIVVNGVPYIVAYMNRTVPTNFFSNKFIENNPHIRISLCFYLSDNRMMIGCRSIHDNQPALDVWNHIEQDCGITKYLGSKGGHKSACGGNYDKEAILKLYEYLEQRRIK